jgi:hypothetical protein
MADADFVMTTGKITLTAAATKSLWLLNPVTNQASLIQIDVSMDASSVVAGVQLDLYIVTTIGSAAGTTGTVNKINSTTQAATTTGLTNLTVEPTAVNVLASWYLQPVGGLYTIQFPLGREPLLTAAGARWGFRAITPASVSPDVISNVWWEE